MLSILLRGILQMNSKQTLIAALLGIATMIAIPITASAFVGHHYGWRNHSSYNSNLICDDDGDDCYSAAWPDRSEEHTSELQSHLNLVCRLLLEKKKELDSTPARP